jgi:hypothetical protein
MRMLQSIRTSRCESNRKNLNNFGLFALTLRTAADTYRKLSAGGELRQSERPAPEFGKALGSLIFLAADGALRASMNEAQTLPLTSIDSQVAGA